jgi:5-oxoprolinase (ATP-hydrolysing)
MRLSPHVCSLHQLTTGIGDVLEWITWGGGGLGDPLTRPAEIVAREVHRRLLTVSGVSDNYGVVVDPHTFVVNEGATETLRAAMREKRLKNGGNDGNRAIDRGGTVSELLASCEEETGHKPPVPQWEKRVYGPHAGLEYVRAWFERMKTEGMDAFDRA